MIISYVSQYLNGLIGLSDVELTRLTGAIRGTKTSLIYLST